MNKKSGSGKKKEQLILVVYVEQSGKKINNISNVS
jgi:hypothetical protein